MDKTFKKISMLMAAAVMTLLFAACHDDDNYSISKAEVDIDRNEVGQLPPTSSVVPFNLVTDQDAEWVAEMEWDRKNGQPAYCYPDSGVGSATLKIATLDNFKPQTRNAKLIIRFPKDESKNITVDLTQKGAVIDNNNEPGYDGNILRGIGYGYNAFKGYCEERCMVAPILQVDEMYENGDLVFSFGSAEMSYREESGASVEELARKLNVTAHASTDFSGFNASVDAAFNGGQKSTSSNEFAWLDFNVHTGVASLHGVRSRLLDRYMTDEAYDDINGIGWVDREGNVDTPFPSTPEGFRELVLQYGTHIVLGGILGGQMRTTVVVNTSKVSSAYNASVALEAGFSSSWANVNASATAKAQQSSAVSSNHSAFYFNGRVRGGNRNDGSMAAMTDLISKMCKARQGAGTQDDLTDDSETKVTISDDSEELDIVGKEWVNSLSGGGGLTNEDLKENVVLIDFDSEDQLVPLYELVNRRRSGGEERYQAFKTWYETEMMRDPDILKQRRNLSSYITIPPTKIEAISDMTSKTYSNSLIRDIYLSNGQHVARVCSEFIPIINQTKRVNVIYPVVNGKARYNLGIFCGDEASYPAMVSWGWEDAPDEPLVTTIKGSTLGEHKVAYLRGNHLTLEPDTSFKESQYLTTTSRPYELVAGGTTYPLVKINDYVYTRNMWKGSTYNNGTPYSSVENGQQLDHLYKVMLYTMYQQAYGGFAPQGWSVPWNRQWRKMISNITDVVGNKPDGTIGQSFLKGGIYGLNLGPEGFFWHEEGNTYRLNSNICYIGALADTDFNTGFWNGVYTRKAGSLTGNDCNAIAISKDEGTISLVNWRDSRPNIIDSTPTLNDATKRITQVWDYLKSNELEELGMFVGYPLILSQKVVK